jgi:class 3 adenylate cyclase/predicted ATPase
VTGQRLQELAAFAPTPMVHAIYTCATQGQPLEIRTQPHAERLSLAILFADISGFTALTEALTRHNVNGAEELTQLLNTYFTQMILQIEAYEGQVVRLSGDAILAIFPIQKKKNETLASAMLKATYAAVDMQEQMSNFQNLQTSIGEASLALKIGIGAGETLVAHVGGVFNRWEYMIAGDAVEQAADAEHHADPGMVVLSPQASALVDISWYNLPPCVTLIDESHERDEPHEVHVTRQKAIGNNPLLRYPRPERVAPHEYHWESLDPEILAQVEKQLLNYVPAAITSRLSLGQSTWFADLRRMTMMFVGVGGLDYNAPNALDVLHTFLASAQTIIYRYEGSLNKIAVDDKGTVLLIMFGAPPLAHEDDSIRTLACARELQQLSTLYIPSSHEPPLHEPHEEAKERTDTEATVPLKLNIAIGITTDNVFAGPVGSPTCCEYTVMGDAVNLASRLMQAAGAGNILCGHSTYSEVLKHWHLEPLPPLLVKGKTQPVRVYQFSGQRAAISAGNTIPLVGRLQEISTLMSYLEHAEEGHGYIISLVGEGGMGKTRLLQECMLLAGQKKSVAKPLLGTAQSIGQQTPYLAWREVLMDYFELDLLLNMHQREQRVRNQAHTINPDLEQRLPLLNDILDINLPETPATRGLNPRQHRESLTFLIVQLLFAWTEESTLLVVLDDMHWADTLSWELALDVARAMAHRRCVLILSYRNPASGNSESWYHEREATFAAINTLPHHHSLGLAPLEKPAIAELASLYMDGKPIASGVIEWLAERSEGNAFFIEETVRMLREHSALVLDEQGTWQLKGETSLTIVPSTLKSVIQSHLDRLQPNIQLTCKVASVIGRIFPERVVAGIYPMHEEIDNLRSYLGILAKQNITPIESVEPEVRYQFKSALTQDVAYSSLLMAHRQKLHEAVAEWYQQEFAANLDPYVPLLADHYKHTERGERFLEFAERAGDLAADKYATAEALDYFSQAIHLLHSRADIVCPLERDRKLFHLLLKREKIYEYTNKTSLREEDLNELNRLVEIIQDDRELALVQLRYARYYQTLNNYDAADKAVKRAIQIGKKLHDSHLLGEGMNILARNAELRADYQQALWWGLQALDYCRAAGDQAGTAHSLNFLGIAEAELGEYTQAEEHHQQALVIRRQIEDRWGEATSLNQLGSLQNLLGRPREALDVYQEALMIRRTIGDRSGEAATLLNIGEAYQALGDLSMAQKYQQEALIIWRELGNQYGQARSLIYMCDTATAVGEFESAQAYAQEGLELARYLENRQFEALCLSKWGNAARELAAFKKREAAIEHHISMHTGRPPVSDIERLVLLAHGQHRAAYYLSRDLGLRRTEAYALHHMGEWEWEWGADDVQERAKAAADHWAAATTIREEIGETDFARASSIRQAHALLEMGDEDRARELADAVWNAWATNPPSGEDENELREGYLSLYQIWSKLDKPQLAMTALAWAYQGVQDRAVCISDLRQRHSFLHRVSINEEIIRTWKAVMGEDEGSG